MIAQHAAEGGVLGSAKKRSPVPRGCHGSPLDLPPPRKYYRSTLNTTLRSAELTNELLPLHPPLLLLSLDLRLSASSEL